MIEIEILNWDKFNPRRDLKKPTWFRLENSLFDDFNFHTFSLAERLFWVFLLCQASKKNEPVFQISHDYARQFGGFDKKTVDSAIQKLKDREIVSINKSVRSTQSQANGSIRSTFKSRALRTNERTNETNERDGVSDSKSDLHPLGETWNLNRGSLPKCVSTKGIRYKKCRSRWQESNPKHTPGNYWMDIVKRIAASDFCTGKNNRGWRATFDWLLQPEVHLKVMEGKYDNQKPPDPDKDFYEQGWVKEELEREKKNAHT